LVKNTHPVKTQSCWFAKETTFDKLVLKIKKCSLTSCSHGTMQSPWNTCLQGRSRTRSFNSKSSIQTLHCRDESRQTNNLSMAFGVLLPGFYTPGLKNISIMGFIGVLNMSGKWLLCVIVNSVYCFCIGRNGFNFTKITIEFTNFGCEFCLVSRSNNNESFNGLLRWVFVDLLGGRTQNIHRVFWVHTRVSKPCLLLLYSDNTTDHGSVNAGCVLNDTWRVIK